MTDRFIDNSGPIKERTARVEYDDKSSLTDRPSDLLEDIGEIVQRDEQLSDMMDFEIQRPKELKSVSRDGQNNMMDSNSPKGSAFTSKRPQLSDRNVENPKDEERVFSNHIKGGNYDDLNVIDRLFSGVI